MSLPDNENIKAVCQYLFPATMLAANCGVKIQTILGSCVSVCLYDPANKVGGMNHFMLPFWNGDGLESPKFGNVAMDMLLTKLIQLGADKASLQAKVFGGANQYTYSKNAFNIGEQNIQLALYALEQFNIPVVASSVGGVYGRKILFESASGQVLMKYITPKNPERKALL
ncbi:MAG TPA: chemotaxis protein CheD [Chryseosolibacter sp.]|nr:chemotaxis protein CheD [Chryseosolibacter sp.]